MGTFSFDDNNHSILRNMLMCREKTDKIVDDHLKKVEVDLLAAEKKIAMAIMDAQKMREESYSDKKEEYTLSIDQCLIATCTKHELSPNMWALLMLAMHWWNDIQCWADDVMAGKNILDECRRPPQPDDVIELTDKARQFADDFRESRLIPPQEMEVDLHIPDADTMLTLKKDGQLIDGRLRIEAARINHCATCGEIYPGCNSHPTWRRTEDNPIVVECESYKKRDRLCNLCDDCESSIADCDGKPEFGDGPGNDNVIVCDCYTIRG